jgi:hypothetical protein
MVTYIKLTVVNPEKPEDEEILYIRSDNPPMGITTYGGYTLLNFGGADNSVLVTECPATVMAMFSAVLDDHMSH